MDTVTKEQKSPVMEPSEQGYQLTIGVVLQIKRALDLQIILVGK